MYIKTFKNTEFNKIKIEYFDVKTTKVPVFSSEISDVKKLDEIKSLMKLLPDVGDKMVSMGIVPVLLVHVFFNSGEVEYFKFYNGRIKTIDTSFYSVGMDAESMLFELLCP